MERSFCFDCGAVAEYMVAVGTVNVTGDLMVRARCAACRYLDPYDHASTLRLADVINEKYAADACKCNP